MHRCRASLRYSNTILSAYQAAHPRLLFLYDTKAPSFHSTSLLSLHICALGHMGQACSGDEARRISASPHGFCYRQGTFSNRFTNPFSDSNPPLSPHRFILFADPLRPQRYQLCFKQAPPTSFGIIVPLYGPYDANKELWAACIDASRRGVPVICLLRPALDDTPLQFADLPREYIDGVTALNSAGVRCVGYIETARCSKNMWLINNEIEAFATWSTHLLCGIFFDHTAMDEGSYSIGYCRQAAQMTRVLVGPLVLFNPGNVPLSLDYRKWANLIVTFEDRYVFFKPRPQDVPATRVYTRKLKDKGKGKDNEAEDKSKESTGESGGEGKGVGRSDDHLDGQSEAYRPGMSAGEKIKSDVEMAGLALRGYRSLIDDDDDDVLDGSASEWEHDDNPPPRAAAAAIAAAASAPPVQRGVDPEVGGTVAAIADKVRENGALPAPAEDDLFVQGEEAAKLVPVAPLGAFVLALGQGLHRPATAAAAESSDGNNDNANEGKSESKDEGKSSDDAAAPAASAPTEPTEPVPTPEPAPAPAPARELTLEEEQLAAKVRARVSQRARRSLRLARTRGFGWVYLAPRASLLTPEGEPSFDRECWDAMVASALDGPGAVAPPAVSAANAPDAGATATDTAAAAGAVTQTGKNASCGAETDAEAPDGQAAVLVATEAPGFDGDGDDVDASAAVPEPCPKEEAAVDALVAAIAAPATAAEVEDPAAADMPRW